MVQPYCTHTGNILTLLLSVGGMFGSDIKLVIFDLDNVLIGASYVSYIWNTLNNAPGNTSAYIIQEGHQLLNTIQKCNAHRNDIRYCILSNASEGHTRNLRRRQSIYRVFQQFHRTYFLWNLYMQKPNNNAFAYVLQQYNVLPQQCILIDDQRINVLAARELGMHVINFNPSYMQSAYTKLSRVGLT